MKNKGGLAVVLAVPLAGGATIAVFLYVQGVKGDEEATTAQNMVTVIVPKQDVPAGTKLDALVSAGAFTTEQVPATAVVPGAITDLVQLQGRTTSTFVLQGEQISTARLQGGTQPTGGLLGIPAGYRAVSISLEGQRAVNGAVQPGDHIVVYATLSRGKGGQETVVVVPDVLVLETTSPPADTAVPVEGQPAGQPTSEGAVLTLALRPRDSAKVILAQAQGSVWLALVPPKEKGQQHPPVTIGELGQP